MIPGLEDPLEKGEATHSSIPAWRISPWDHKESDTTEQFHHVISCEGSWPPYSIEIDQRADKV